MKQKKSPFTHTEFYNPMMIAFVAVVGLLAIAMGYKALSAPTYISPKAAGALNCPTGTKPKTENVRRCTTSKAKNGRDSVRTCTNSPETHCVVDESYSAKSGQEVLSNPGSAPKANPTYNPNATLSNP